MAAEIKQRVCNIVMKLSEIFNEFASQESPSLMEQRETGFNSDPAL
jgi:hypothetical protein